MKILYGITKSNFGGAQRYVFDLAQQAKLAGHDVAVLCGGEGVLVEKLKAENIRVISIPGFGRDMDLLRDAYRLWFIIKTVRQEKPEVFHINSAKMGGAGVFSGRLLGVPKIVFTAHGWAFNEPRPLWQKLLIKFFTWVTIVCAHKTICVSEKSREQVAGWPFIKNKLLVVRNGISSFELLPKTDHSLTVGTLAELHKIKGLDVLLQAWQPFLDRRPEAKLVIMGEGEERNNLEVRARELGIADSVAFKGQVENARKHLLEFDIFVLPSRSENLPYSVLEAGFASLPVIASRVGGIPEIIETGVSGALVEPDNSREILSTLILFADDKILRERLGLALKEKVSAEFSLKKMAENTLKIYS